MDTLGRLSFFTGMGPTILPTRFCGVNTHKFPCPLEDLHHQRNSPETDVGERNVSLDPCRLSAFRSQRVFIQRIAPPLDIRSFRDVRCYRPHRLWVTWRHITPASTDLRIYQHVVQHPAHSGSVKSRCRIRLSAKSCGNQVTNTTHQETWSIDFFAGTDEPHNVGYSVSEEVCVRRILVIVDAYGDPGCADNNFESDRAMRSSTLRSKQA